MDLSKTSKNKKYRIIEIKVREDLDLERRFHNLGFHAGMCIELKRKAPLFGNPLLFEIENTLIALTKSEASCILVEDENDN